MNNLELNEKIEEVIRTKPEIAPRGIDNAVPFLGNWWRFTKFDKPVWLGKSPYLFDDGKPIDQWVGICSRPMYIYNCWKSTEEQTVKIKEFLETLVTTPTLEASLALFDYLQTLDNSSSSSTQLSSSQVLLT